ncbi:hypothetical protein ON010_g15450 [Phytophthora cinnamomi]|nr:hypothetical protein ON010_g15450 [Phytophthora cinnamomi]
MVVETGAVLVAQAAIPSANNSIVKTTRSDANAEQGTVAYSDEGQLNDPARRLVSREGLLEPVGAHAGLSLLEADDWARTNTTVDYLPPLPRVVVTNADVAIRSAISGKHSDLTKKNTHTGRPGFLVFIPSINTPSILRCNIAAGRQSDTSLGPCLQAAQSGRLSDWERSLGRGPHEFLLRMWLPGRRRRCGCRADLGDGDDAGPCTNRLACTVWSVVGIDLGTTYSVVAISQKNNVTAIADDQGHVLVPSTVAFLPNGGVIVGREARAHRTTDPQHTIFNAKRFIGRSYEDVVESEVDSNGATPYEFAVKPVVDNAHDGVCFALDVSGQQQECVTPVQIGSAVVSHLRSMAHRFVGHDQITKAVIAVPVDFNARQRDATVAAFRAAGLEVSRVLEEPTAAAIAYGLHQDPNVSFMLVFDFGGGTLDVSLLFARNGAISVLDTLGDNHLGGEDVDAQLAAWLVKEFEAKIGSPIPSRGAEFEVNGFDDDASEPPCTLAGVRRTAELLKRRLTDASTASVACIWREGENPIRVEVRTSRAQFEELCGSLLERTMIPVREVLEANNMETEEIDAVVLVGGSSRIPWVRQRLAAMFQGRAPLSTIDPDLAVAYGAARTLD